MVSKGRRKAGRASGAVGPTPGADVERLIAKGRYKEAVKEAKLAVHREATPGNHRLLERAYLLRAQQLQQGGMATAAREVAGHLLDSGITDPALVGPAAELLIALGMADRALALQQRLGAPEERGHLVRHAADQAVLHPDRAPLPEVREGALRVREALGALEVGDEARALELLRDVPRSSPFSEWRLFVRGLAASHRGATEEQRSNWDRLDPGRAPARIVGAWRALEGTEAGPSPSEGSDVPAADRKLELLERRAFGEPVLRPLRQLGELVARGRWPEAIRALGPLRAALRRIDPAPAERLTRILYGMVIRAASDLDFRRGSALARSFTGAAEPLAIDPRWNRFWALTWEGPQGHIDEAEPYWRQYVEDLRDTPALRPEERPRAQALVWEHLGKGLLDEADALAPAPGRRRIDRETRAYRGRAVACLEESLALCPARRRPYRALIDAYEAWGEPDKAAEVARRLIAALPDDLDTLLFLSEHHSRGDEPAEALEYVRRARALKPLDAAIARLEWGPRVALARRHAIAGRFDEGRAELEAAERIRPEMARSTHFLARRAAFELRAGQDDLAGRWIAEAQAALPEPAPLWLALRIEATRFELPAAERDRFEALWAAARPRRVKGETAAALAGLLSGFLAGEVTYPGRDEHVKQVVDYLRRTTRIKYRREDLAGVCGFLGLVPGEAALLEKLVRRGLKLFPEAPEFPMILGAIEMEKGPFRGDLARARTHFEAALALAEAQATGDPKAAELVPKLRESLNGLRDLFSGPAGLPFGPMPGGAALPDELLDMIAALGGDLDPFDEGDFLEDDEGDFLEGEGAPPIPLPAPAARPRRPAPGGKGARARKKGKR